MYDKSLINGDKNVTLYAILLFNKCLCILKYYCEEHPNLSKHNDNCSE